MSNQTLPAIIISGVSSGSGKTTVTIGLMAAFAARGMRVQPFKCGPDFIDPGLHQLVCGRVSRNLDQWMSGPSFTRQTFFRNLRDADIAIIEGVMGMFDGGDSSSGSLAQFLDIPTILVIDVRSMAESAAAIVKGFETLNPQAEVRGVILNRVASDRHLQLASDAIRKHCQAEILGHLPRSLDFSIPSRHLGLLTGDEAPISTESIKLLVEAIEAHIDLDRLSSFCSVQKTPETTEPFTPPVKCRIGVARDKAFCFYYEDNFDLLRSNGAELVFFSPLTDSQLPPDLHGLYLGGGYPELYARELSANGSMIKSVRDFADNNHVIYAECGGFMYLTEGIIDENQEFHRMISIFPVKAEMQTKRTSLGYREVATCGATCFGPAGTILRGHEFHYSKIGEMNEDVPRMYRVSNGTLEGYASRRVLGGYMHLHFGYSPQAAREFINYCLENS